MKAIINNTRKRYYVTGIMAVLFFFTACKKFLEQPSPDEFVPSTIEELQNVLSREGYPSATRPFHPYVSLLDDDIKCMTPDPAANSWKQGKPAFTWSKKMYSEMQMNGDNDVDTYAKYYQQIKGCNVVLDMIHQVKGSRAKKNQLEGEARVLRAYYYFTLVNLYGWSFTDSLHTPDKAMGVPLVLTGKIADAALRRSTVLDVYSQIVNDITTGSLLLEEGDNHTSVFNISKYAAWLLAGRVFLYMGNWDQVIVYTNKLLAERPMLEDMCQWVIPSGDSIGNAYQPCYINPSNKEVLFLYGCVKEYSLLGIDSFHTAPCYYASDALNAAFEKGDLRAAAYVNTWRITGVFTKVNYKAHLGKSFRVAEAYLNRAEAAIRKYMQHTDATLLQSAVADLNLLRQHRFDARHFIPETVAHFCMDPHLILQFCLDERRRELCFEENRWFDLRRCGMPAITHFYYPNDKQKPQAYQLPEKSTGYVLPIPDMALTNNPLLIQNP
jgi:hypothetical protein